MPRHTFKRFTLICPACDRNDAPGDTRALRVNDAGAPLRFPRHECGTEMLAFSPSPDTAEGLLAECLRALNCAARFNYGPKFAGWRDRYGKPDSYELAARIEAFQKAREG